VKCGEYDSRSLIFRIVFYCGVSELLDIVECSNNITNNKVVLQGRFSNECQLQAQPRADSPGNLAWRTKPLIDKGTKIVSEISVGLCCELPHGEEDA